MSILNDENWNKLPQMQKYLTAYKFSEILVYIFNYLDKDDFDVYVDEYIKSNYPQFAKFFNENGEEMNEAMQSNTNDNIFAKYFEDAVKKYAKGDSWKP